MNVQSFLQELRSNALLSSNSTDQLLLGSPEKDLSKIAVCMFPTVQVIRQAQSRGADLLITHEPLFYGINGTSENSIVVQMKNKLLQTSLMAVYRYHDQAHLAVEDEIALGFISEIGLQGILKKTRYLSIAST